MTKELDSENQNQVQITTGARVPISYRGVFTDLEKQRFRTFSALDSKDFWQELRTDMETVEEDKTTLWRFLHYFPDDTHIYHKRAGGKYHMHAVFFGDFAPSGRTWRNLSLFLAEDFTPSPDNQELVDAVNATREVIKRKFLDRHQSEAKTSIPDILVDPEFWAEMSNDLSSFETDAMFSQFLLHFDPKDQQSFNKGSYSGKYRNLYSNLNSYLYFQKVKSNQQNGPAAVTTEDLDRNQLFYRSAPDTVKLQLVATFPKEFGSYVGEVLERHGLFPQEAKLVVAKASLLSADSKHQILAALIPYLRINRGTDTPLPITEQRLISLFGQVADSTITQKRPTSTGEVVYDIQGIISAFDTISSSNPDLLHEAKEVVHLLDYLYYTPLTKSFLYRPASLFWGEYLKQHPDASTVPTTLIIDFLKSHLKGGLDPLRQQDNHSDALAHFESRILERVCDEFAEIATFAPKIHHFKRRNSQGNPKHLFFHQVEGIKHLLEQGGNILSDEPGTGKTLILALAAMGVIDRNPSTQGQGKILVVGSKAVIDNWEGELKLHIDDDAISIANLNFTEETEKTGLQYSIQQRLAGLDHLLSEPDHKKQFTLVNYDVFRNPRFQKLLEKYRFDAVIIDEAHNVKSRFLDSISETQPTSQPGQKGKTAKRTVGLYRYLKNHPDTSVFIATATPYVKEFIEPLIMAHLINPHQLSTSRVEELMHDAIGTHQALRNVMIRRRKEEIADLPPKETTFIPISLNTMSDDDQAAFYAISQELLDRYPKKFARFYAMLSLEGQAKYPWLINKVKELNSQGKHVVIYTPFVAETGTLTASVSTVAIAERLQKAGISSVGVLDGRLTDNQRVAVQRDFHRKDGIQNLVGNYLTAGESITLNSSENRATEVILFVSPNSISRYLQAVDRVHRFGQNEKVTIHIPYTTGDLLDRNGGTYDERVVNRITRELTQFGAVIDGLFFVEARDYYQDVVLSEGGSSQDKVEFEVDRVRSGAERILRGVSSKRKEPKEARTQEPKDDFTDLPETDFTQSPTLILHGATTVDLGQSRTTAELYALSKAEEDLAWLFKRDILQYPLLTREQEQIFFRYFKTGRGINELRVDERFTGTVGPLQAEPFQRLFDDSPTVKDAIANANYRLVTSESIKLLGLSHQDLVQEGSIGLLHAIDRYDLERAKFSTYATWWIRQAMFRAVQDQSRTIRLPVHILEDMNKVRRIAEAAKTVTGTDLTVDQLRETVLQNTDVDETRFNSVIRVTQSGVVHMDSLNRKVSQDGDEIAELGHFIEDKNASVEEIVIGDMGDSEIQQEVRLALSEDLTSRERRVIEGRFGIVDGIGRTLEVVAQQEGVTRERIRQIQDKSLAKLRGNDRLRAQWEDAPIYLYRGLSAEEAAFRMGLFNDSSDKAATARKSSQVGPLFNTDEVTLEVKEKTFEEKAEMAVGAMKNPAISRQIPDQEKSILTLYSKKGGNKEALLGRMEKIFGLTHEELIESVEDTVDSIVRLSKEIHRSSSITSKSNTVTSHESSSEIDSIIEEAIRKGAGKSNTEIAIELSDKLNAPVATGAVASIRKKLGDERQPDRMIVYSSEKAELVDSRVESLFKAGPKLTFERLSNLVQQPLSRVISSAVRLHRAGKIDSLAYTEVASTFFNKILHLSENKRLNISTIASELHLDEAIVEEVVEYLQVQGRLTRQTQNNQERSLASQNIKARPDTEKAHLLDSQVEILLAQNPNLTYRQVANQLGESESRVTTSISRLLRAGKATRRPSPEQQNRHNLRKYVEDRKGQMIDLSDYAREAGISQDSARKIYEEFLHSEPTADIDMSKVT